MSIADQLIIAGTRQSQRVHGRSLVLLSTGAMVIAQPEVQEQINLDTDLGTDPRESTFFHFLRPGPAISMDDRLSDPVSGCVWEVVSDREDNPMRPTVKYRVQKVVNE